MNRKLRHNPAPGDSVIVYGLKNCDSCRKALRWLTEHGITHRFKDLRETELESQRLENWCRRVDWNVLLNRKSTTWRSLDPTQRQLSGEAQARALILDHPVLLKRPVLEAKDQLLVGFDAEVYQQTLCGSES
jgi:Spx/MgsR family transcriptional regulator